MKRVNFATKAICHFSVSFLRSKNSLVIPRLAHATALASVPDDHAAILFTDSYKVMSHGRDRDTDEEVLGR